MKKPIRVIVTIFVIMIVLSVLSALLLLGLSLFKDDIYGSDKSPILTNYELSMELTENFEYDFYKGYGGEDVYVSNKHLVGIYHTTIEKITIEGNPPPSLETYASLFFPIWVGLKDIDEIELKEIDGILCYEADINQDGNTDSFISFFETQTSFYFVRMTYDKNKTTYEESRDLFISWAKRVTLTEYVPEINE